eukprot:scaffold3625_cov82-Cylindrotheca_fusiformis.AAC.3
MKERKKCREKDSVKDDFPSPMKATGRAPVVNSLFRHSAAKKGAGKKKKPLSGFMKFSQEHRAKVKEENEGISFGQIGKKLGEMWRELTDEEKEAYKTK